MAELRAGEDLSIADVANAHGVDPGSIDEAVVEKAAERLAEKVDSGQLTQAEADQRLAQLEERVTERINTPFSPPDPGERPQRGVRPQRGQRGPADTA